MSLWKRFRGFTYRMLYKFGEWHEKYELGFICFELLLIAYVITPESVKESNFDIPFFRESLEKIDTSTHGMELKPWMHRGEFIAGGILILLALSRIGILVRRRGLGYRYTRLTGWLSEREIEIGKLLGDIKNIQWGYAPGHQREAASLQRFADRIANHTAGLLSIRTLYDIDEIWRQRERESLGEWFDKFPAALWRLPIPNNAEVSNPIVDSGDTDGYYSVIVPMTASSSRSIRRGQRATDLAEVPNDLAAAWHTQKLPIHTNRTDKLRVELLAYLHIFVSSKRDIPVEEQRLFAASVQHIAFLLYALYGASGEFRDNWNFSILCESANERMGRLLSHLGFRPLPQISHERNLGPIEPCKSYAGFQLFEFSVNMGELPADALTADGREFLHLLQDCVRDYAARQTATINVSSLKAI